MNKSQQNGECNPNRKAVLKCESLMFQKLNSRPIACGFTSLVLALLGSQLGLDSALVYLLASLGFVLVMAGSIVYQSDRLSANSAMQSDPGRYAADQISRAIDAKTESKKDELEMIDHDVFICHASEDKASVVEPVVRECTKRSVTCWYDRTNLKWGDDLAGAIARGVQKSRFVLVVASEHAAAKGWPLREISQAIEREVRQKQTVVLPLFVGDRERLLEKFPQLDGKLGKQWENNPDEVADEIAKLFGQGKGPSPTDVSDSITTRHVGQTMPHLPSLPKTYTDLDRIRFIRDAFQTITRYFESAAELYSAKEPRVTSETERLDNAKFALVLYVDGSLKHQCQIWIDDSFGRYPNIHYFGGKDTLKNYNARNESISITETKDGLRLKGSMGSFEGEYIENSTAEQVAAILWGRFVKWIKM